MNYMKIIRITARILIGLIFIYSGYVKAVDPLGSTYKFEDYFKDGFGMDWAMPIAFPLAFLLSAIEFTIGVCLLMGVRMRFNAWMALLFMAFFTPLTFYLAVANPVSDCGCFGDALILTNWQTFWKNVIILLPTVFIFWQRKKYHPVFNLRAEWTFFTGIFIASTGLSVFCYNHLPIMDFRPYNIGTYIPKKMEIPPDAPQPEYEFVFMYEKDGVQKEFTMDSLPDETWTFVDRTQTLIKPGYEPPIHDFTISSPEVGDITDEILQEEQYTFLVISHDINEASTEHQQQLNQLAKYCLDTNMRFICMTSSLQTETEEFRKKYKVPYKFYATDGITLKTIVRSNPGLVLLREGTIIDKWHHNDLPSIDYINDQYLAGKSLTRHVNKKENYLTLALALLFTSVLILILFGNYYLKKRERSL